MHLEELRFETAEQREARIIKESRRELKYFHWALAHRRLIALVLAVAPVVVMPLFTRMLNIIIENDRRKLRSSERVLSMANIWRAITNSVCFIGVCIMGTFGINYPAFAYGAFAMFNFGRDNQYDPLNNHSLFKHYKTYSALRWLYQSAPAIYNNQPLDIITTDSAIMPRYIVNNKTFPLTFLWGYMTPYELAQELNAHKVQDLFKVLSAEEHNLLLLIKARVDNDGVMTCLDDCTFLNMLAFVAGANTVAYIRENKRKATDLEPAELERLNKFELNYAAHQRNRIPGLLTYFADKRQWQEARQAPATRLAMQ